MAEQLLLYVESTEHPYPGEAPLRFPFAAGAKHQVAHPVHELDNIEVVIRQPWPGARYLLRVGDMEFSPSLLSNGLIWEAQKFLANYRGWVPLQVSRETGGERIEMSVELACLPSKITEDQYTAMVEEIDRVSRGMILDIIGVRADVGWRRRTVTTDLERMEEHEAIAALLDRIRPNIYRLLNQDALRLKSARQRKSCWGREELDHQSINELVSSGVDPRDPGSRPFLCSVRERTLTMELHENRQVGHFLFWLQRRLSFIAQMVEGRIEQIDEDRWWRDRERPDGRSIWQVEDEPRRQRLEAIVETCRELRRSIWRDVQELTFLKPDSRPMDLRPTAIFLRHPIYSELYRAMLSFISAHGAIFDRADFETQARAKGTDKLYEYWVYLNILRYLAERGGLEVEERGGLFERSAKLGAYALTIERSSVTFRLDDRRTLRVHYTPLIFRRDEAARRNLPFFRLGDGLPYSPDFMFEVREEGRLKMGVILDAKYMKDVSREMRDLRKYLTAIRDAETGEAFSRSLWLLYVGDPQDDQAAAIHTEVHADRPVFAQNDASRVDVRGNRAVVIGSMRFAPRPWEGPDNSLDQLDVLLRPLLRDLNAPGFRYPTVRYRTTTTPRRSFG